MNEPEEREQLQALVSSPGWHVFLKFARASFGAAGYGVRVKQAIQEAKAAGKDVAEAVGAVDAASDAINGLLSWPETRIRHLEAAEAQRKMLQEPSMSRRGHL